MLSDTCGGQTGILTCVDTGQPLVDATTIASIVMDLGEGTMTIVPRAEEACHTRYVLRDLGP